MVSKVKTDADSAVNQLSSEVTQLQTDLAAVIYPAADATSGESGRESKLSGLPVRVVKQKTAPTTLAHSRVDRFQRAACNRTPCL
jgi:hypothetical protein